MAYRTRAKSRRPTRSRSSSYRAPARRTNSRRAPARGVRRTSARQSPQTIRIVIQSAPAPSLSSPTPEMQSKAKVAKF